MTAGRHVSWVQSPTLCNISEFSISSLSVKLNFRIFCINALEMKIRTLKVWKGFRTQYIKSAVLCKQINIYIPNYVSAIYISTESLLLQVEFLCAVKTELIYVYEQLNDKHTPPPKKRFMISYTDIHYVHIFN